MDPWKPYKTLTILFEPHDFLEFSYVDSGKAYLLNFVVD